MVSTGNYSGIYENNNRIKDLFKKFELRTERVERSHAAIVSAYFMNLEQQRKEGAIIYEQQLDEEARERRNNTINLDTTGNKCIEMQQYIKNPMCAKDGLDTGLSKDRKLQVRNDEVQDPKKR